MMQTEIAPGKRARRRKFFSRLGIAVALLFGLLSLLPYLIPPLSLEGDRHELAFQESVFAEVGGVELHYRFWESGGKQGNVLLVHGFGGSTFTWRHTVPALVEAGFDVAAVDLPGFGLSERRSGLDHTQQGRAELLWALLDELLPGGNWHLAGHSMGGGTVAAMALQHPGRVDRVVLAAGSLPLEGGRQPNPLLRYPPARRWIKVLSTRLMLSEERVAGLVESAYGRPVTAEELAGYFAPLTVAGSDAVLVDLQSGVTGEIFDGIGQLERPVLCIWGEADSWVPLERGETLVQALPRAELAVIPGEGHCPMETAPEEFNDLMLEFLEN